MQVSASKMNTFMKCPLQGKFKYIDKLPTRSSSASVYGNVVHAAIEHYNRNGDVVKAKKLFEDWWADPSKLGLTIDIWLPRTNAGNYRLKGLEAIQGFHDRATKIGREVIAVEYGFKVPIGEHDIVGYVDLLEVRKSGKGKDIIRVVDIKTGRTPNQDNLRNNIQFTSYDYAVSRPEFWLGYPGDEEYQGMPNGGELWDKYKNMPRRGCWWDVTNDKEIDVGERTEKDYGRLYRVIEEIDKAVSLNVFVPNLTGDSCAFCDFREQCSLTIPSSEERMKGNEWF